MAFEHSNEERLHVLALNEFELTDKGLEVVGTAMVGVAKHLDIEVSDLKKHIAQQAIVGWRESDGALVFDFPVPAFDTAFQVIVRADQWTLRGACSACSKETH